MGYPQWFNDNPRTNSLRKHLDHLRLVLRSPRLIFGITVIAFFILCAIFASRISPYDPLKVDLRARYQPPSASHLLGTDFSGRDILTRLIWGSRISLFTALFSVSFGVAIGVFLGVVAGYYGGKVDALISRFIDIMLTLPSFIMAIALMAVLGRSLVNLTIAIGIALSPRIARLVRGTALSIKENQFVEAARSFGYSDWRIILRHIIPHSLTPVVVFATFSLGAAVMTEAGLSFLGLGVPPPAPSLGQMVAAGGTVIRELPYYSISAGFCIVMLILGFNLLGDGLRDNLDPRLRGEVR